MGPQRESVFLSCKISPNLPFFFLSWSDEDLFFYMSTWDQDYRKTFETHFQNQLLALIFRLSGAS